MSRDVASHLTAAVELARFARGDGRPRPLNEAIETSHDVGTVPS